MFTHTPSPEQHRSDVVMLTADDETGLPMTVEILAVRGDQPSAVRETLFTPLGRAGIPFFAFMALPACQHKKCGIIMPRVCLN